MQAQTRKEIKSGVQNETGLVLEWIGIIPESSVEVRHEAEVKTVVRQIIGFPVKVDFWFAQGMEPETTILVCTYGAIVVKRNPHEWALICTVAQEAGILHAVERITKAALFKENMYRILFG